MKFCPICKVFVGEKAEICQHGHKQTKNDTPELPKELKDLFCGNFERMKKK